MFTCRHHQRHNNHLSDLSALNQAHDLQQPPRLVSLCWNESATWLHWMRLVRLYFASFVLLGFLTSNALCGSICSSLGNWRRWRSCWIVGRRDTCGYAFFLWFALSCCLLFCSCFYCQYNLIICLLSRPNQQLQKSARESTTNFLFTCLHFLFVVDCFYAFIYLL